MRLEQLLYCIEIARCGKMSQASKKLFMTQSSLSIAIQNLEEELGFKIFNRSHYGVSLTEQGAIFIKKAEIIEAQIYEIRSLTNYNVDMVKKVTIAAVPSICSAVTLELVQILKNEGHKINLNILEQRPNEILSSLVDGRADVVIGNYSEGNRNAIYSEAIKNNIIIEPIFEEQMYAFLGRNHPLAQQEQVTMGELLDEPQVIFSGWSLMEADQGSLKQPEIVKDYYTLSDKSSIKKLVANSIAYAILPSSMAYDDIYLDSGWIKALPIVDVDVTLTIYVAYEDSDISMITNRLIVSILKRIYQKIAVRMEAENHNKRCSSCNNNLLIY